jgi:hypothetical protein
MTSEQRPMDLNVFIAARRERDEKSANQIHPTEERREEEE